MTQFPRLLGDIGGTNVRWGWQGAANEPIRDVESTECGCERSIYDAAVNYVQSHGLTNLRAAGLGVAAPISGDAVSLTNNGWRFSIAELKKALSIERCLVINDFTALALSLPGLREADVRTLSGDRSTGASQAAVAVEGEPIAVLGPGTGLGVSGLFPIVTGTNGSAKTSWRAIAGEGGHITLAAATDRESAVIDCMRSRQAHISAEDVLSGSGLVRLYRAVCEVEGYEQQRIEAHEISAAAIAKSDSACVLTVKQFSAFLGSVAGNLALTLGAKGGVYIGGGIVPKLGTAFDELVFRRRFEEKGRFIEYLRPIPTWVITAENPALVGASNALTWAEQ